MQPSGMSDPFAILFIAINSEFFALIHHLSLAARTRAAARQGIPEAVTTTQRDLLRLQAVAGSLVGVALAVRAALGGAAAPAAMWGWMAFITCFACGIYVKYPDAAPIAVFSPDWQSGHPSAGFMTAMRGLWIAIAVMTAPLFLGLVAFAV